MTVDETRIWIDHLNTVVENRRRGAAKAAATRKENRRQAAVKAANTKSQHCKQQNGSTSSRCTGRQSEVRTRQEDSSTSSTQPDQEEWYCELCGESYSSTKAPFWVECDLCDSWYWSICEQLNEEPTETEVYFCSKCTSA